MATTYYASVAAGTAAGTSFANAKEFTAAAFSSTVLNAVAGDTIAFLNTGRYPITAALQTLNKQLTLIGLKADGTEPVWKVDPLPVFYGTGLGERAHPWPTDATVASSAAQGVPCFRVNHIPTAHSEFKNLAFTNLKYGIQVSGTSTTAQVRFNVRFCKFVNVTAPVMTDASADGRLTDPTIEDIVMIGYSRSIRFFPQGTVTVRRVAGDAQRQFNGGTVYPAVLQIMEDATWSNDRNISMTTTVGSTTVTAAFLATDAGAGISGTGIPSNSLIISVNVAAGTAVITQAATVASTVNRTVTKHAHLGTEVQTNITVERLVGLDNAATGSGETYSQGDGIVVEEQIHPLGSVLLKNFVTKGNGDRGIDVKCGGTVRNHFSTGDYRGVAQHRDDVVTAANPIVMTAVELLVEDSVYTEAPTPRPGAALAQASGNLRLRRCLFRQVAGNNVNVALIRTDANTAGPPHDFGNITLEQKCRLIKAASVEQTRALAGTTITLGDSVTS